MINNKQDSIFYFSTESVSEGHPDKVADQIAEMVLDYFVERDSKAHVACEVLVNGKTIHITGEVKWNRLVVDDKAKAEIQALTEKLIKKDIQYNEKSWPRLVKVEINVDIQNQSSEIDQQVSGSTNSSTIHAGDNSSVYGWAEYNEQTNHFPPFQFLANRILEKIAQLRKRKSDNYHFAPDGKIQILTHNNQLKKIVLCQQFETATSDNLEAKIKTEIIDEIVRELALVPQSDYGFKLISFVLGGPESDTGLTGRKLMIDTYGTYSRHGGGSFAGKDATKPDKTLALFARYIAKNIVHEQLAKWIEVQITTHIGQENSFQFAYQANANANKAEIEKRFSALSQWKFVEVINKLQLTKTKFQPFARYGYFGRTEKAPWERVFNSWELLPSTARTNDNK